MYFTRVQVVLRLWGPDLEALGRPDSCGPHVVVMCRKRLIEAAVAPCFRPGPTSFPIGPSKTL